MRQLFADAMRLAGVVFLATAPFDFWGEWVVLSVCMVIGVLMLGAGYLLDK